MLSEYEQQRAASVCQIHFSFVWSELSAELARDRFTRLDPLTPQFAGALTNPLAQCHRQILQYRT